MLSPDEQDDNNTFDQLKSIRPFTIDQLYLLHPDVGCPPSSSPALQAECNMDKLLDIDKEVYQNLVEYDQLRRRLFELKSQVKKIFKKAHDHVDKAWVFKEESIRKIAMCQQGKIAETTFKYKQAFVSTKHLEDFSLGFTQLIDAITKDYIYYSFESQMKRNKIATKLSIAYQIDELESRRNKLKSTLTALIEFLKRSGDSKSDFVMQCRRWFRALAKRMLEENTTENYCFIISQLAKGPFGTADWSSDLIECKPFEQVTNFDSVPQYITHCSALLAELFYSLRSRICRVAAAEAATTSRDLGKSDCDKQDADQSASDQNWSLVDPRFACFEELNIVSSSGLLSETDVIKLCLRVPVAQIFRAYVKKCLANDDDEFCFETDKSYEYIMLKLLTIGTIIIKTYQIGLETFNSMQYGSLIEYLSSQIRRTVIILSEKWIEFKNRLKGVDDALLMRLQVEYDNFMLRSILIILELRQSGIWRHLSRIGQNETFSCDRAGCEIEESPQGWTTDSLRPAFAKLLQITGLSNQSTNNPDQSQTDSDPSNNVKSPNLRSEESQRPFSSSLTYEFSIEWFREVSEPMLWHILWLFYHNAFVSSCDYNSDNYWLEKFKEKSVVYLFVNKIKDSPSGECGYLLNSITSMLLSRSRPDSKLINFIASEIFNLSYRHKMLRDKITKNGTRSLVRCTGKFPNLVSLYLTLMTDVDYTAPDVSDLSEDVIELFKGCSLKGWLCNHDELDLLASWLIEFPIDSTQNKVSRLILSKILLNSQHSINELNPLMRKPGKNSRKTSSINSINSKFPSTTMCFVDLKMRRRLALLLYEASVRHLSENNEFAPQSLGAFVEVAIGELYYEQTAEMQYNLMELAVDITYQQFYVWVWRLLFTLRLHILNQPETDWNDLKSRSGTSRSIRNTVLVDDSFHPVPTLQDSECLSLANGVKNQNPVASFIYLMLTDASWQADTFNDCLVHLNILSNSGHTTPSLLAMKCFTICHLNDLSELAVKDKKCLEYFTTLVSGNFDATRLASLIMCQLDCLQQYRQLQLSQFYVHTFLEVANIISRRISASWFNSDELSLEKIACLLDYLVKFNFTTQRTEIIHKFYDCAFVMQDGDQQATTGWFGSFFASNSINVNTTKREFLTNLHALSQKFKKYTWLRWITTECDTLRLEKIWEDIVVYLSGHEEADLDSAIRRVCPQVNANILRSILPIRSWINQIFDIMETDLNHPLCPLIWYNFFLHYFANSLNGTSVGYKLVPQETIVKLMARLDSLFNYHLYKQKNWSASGLQQNSLAQLYRAYKLWLHDSSLRDAYVDMDKLKEDYLVPLLKAVMESSSGSDACLQYIDVQSIGMQNKNLKQIWLAATRLTGNHSIDEIIVVDSTADDSMEVLTSIDDEASDATSLIANSNLKSNADSNHNDAQASEKSPFLNFAEDELSQPLEDDEVKEKYRTFDELIDLVRRNFNFVFEEANIFYMNIGELDRTKTEIKELVKQLYKNKKRDLVRTVTCSDGNECIGPARIKLEFEEALIDERKSHCIQDRRRQCQELVGELLLMPKNRSVQSSVIIEESIKRLIGDPSRSRHAIESLLKWMSEPNNYIHLNGNYHVANHLLKTSLEILSTSDQVDAYNAALINVCIEHPESVQIFSPHLSPSSCSSECFLDLYKTVTCEKQKELGPMATFVLLSKFDLNLWFDNVKQRDKQMHHQLIRATCSALKNMGKDPDERYELAMGLFRRHLQIELALPDRRKPDELILVLSEFLEIMKMQQLAPRLWVDFMAIMGFETRKKRCSMHKNVLTKAIASSPKRSAASQRTLDELSIVSLTLTNSPTGQEYDESTIESIVNDVTQQAEGQIIFDYHSLDSLIKLVTNFMKRQHEASNVTLLELYSEYLDNYSTFMLSATIMWIRATSEQYPDNHDMIWEQFWGMWYGWVFLEKNCQNVGKSGYSLVVNYFVASIRYMIHKIPDNTQSILQSVLSSFTRYISHTREVVYLELTILQRSLNNLPWSSLLGSPEDFDSLCALSEQQNYNISILVSHIVMQFDANKSLALINQQDPNLTPIVSEKFASTIIMQSTHLKGYRLHGIYFSSIPVDRITRLANMILQRMEFVNLEHNQNNKLLVNLLRFICIKLSSPQPQQQSSIPEDNYKRSLIYAQFVSSYLIDLIKRYPSVAEFNRGYLAAVLDNSLQDLKPLLLTSDLNLVQKTILYEGLMECCNSDSLESDQRLLLSQLIIDSSLLKNRPIVGLEILHAVGQILRDSQVLVQTVEGLILMYLSMSGHYEKVWKCFCLKVLPSDIYLSACVELKAPLALLVYFESLARGKQSYDLQLDERASSRKLDMEDENSCNQSTISNSSNTFNANRIWSSFFHWLAQLVSATSSNEANDETILTDTKLATALIRMLELFETNMPQFLLGDNRSTGVHSTSSPNDQMQQQQDESIADNLSQEQVEDPSAGPTEPPPAAKLSKKQQATDLATKLQSHHKFLLELIKQLIALYNSLNSGGIWSYLSIATRGEHSARMSITSLAVASFLVDRTLVSLSSMSGKEIPEHLLALREEITKYHRICVSKLVAARKSKNFSNYTQFIETMIECTQRRGEKVQYIEGVQLITTYVRLAFSPTQSTTTNRDASTQSGSAIAGDAIEATSMLATPSSTKSNEASISACLSKILPTL